MRILEGEDSSEKNSKESQSKESQSKEGQSGEGQSGEGQFEDSDSRPESGPGKPGSLKPRDEGLEGFVANEAMSRFDLPPAPTHLLDWEITSSITGKQASNSHPRNSDREAPEGSFPDIFEKSSGRDDLIEKFSEKFESMLAQGGRQALSEHRDALQGRLNTEENRIDQLTETCQYRDSILTGLIEPRIEEADGTSIDWKTPPEESFEMASGERVTTRWLEDLPDGFEIETQEIGHMTWSLKIRVSDKKLSNEITTSSFPGRGLEIAPMPSTWEELKQNVQDKFSPFVEKRTRAEEVLDLIRFQLALLRQYMWAYDLLGDSPKLTGIVSVPPEVASKERSLKHALTAATILRETAEKRPFPSQSAFKDLIDERLDKSGLTGNTVLKGTKRILDILTEGTVDSTEGTDLMDTLQKYAAKLARQAEELSISPHPWKIP